jgi:hypothetical protein
VSTIAVVPRCFSIHLAMTYVHGPLLSAVWLSVGHSTYRQACYDVQLVVKRCVVLLTHTADAVVTLHVGNLLASLVLHRLMTIVANSSTAAAHRCTCSSSCYTFTFSATCLCVRWYMQAGARFLLLAEFTLMNSQRQYVHTNLYTCVLRGYAARCSTPWQDAAVTPLYKRLSVV